MAPRPRTSDLKLGFFEKLGLIPIFAAVLGKTFFTALTAKLVSKNKRPQSFARYVGYTMLRTLISQNNSRTEQSSSLGTDENYVAWCKQANVQPVTETTKDGTKAYWVGSKGARNLILYFHGGGYNIPAYPQQFALLDALIKAVGPAAPGGLAALVLHYDVAPWAAYPRQLGQAAALLNHARGVLGVPAANIVLSGDSAGGNLALALLSHILHPHPDAALVPRIEGELGGEGGERLRGALLISPWCSFDTEAASYRRNETRDMLHPAALARWSTLFLGGRPTDPYNQPVDVEAGWWKGLGKVVRDVLFVGGDLEVLLDSILNCADNVRNEWKGEGACDVVVVEGEGHDSCWVDTMFGFKNEDTKMFGEMERWLKAKL